jgi:GNAT superfamily N-acetyltransferase
MSLTIDIAEGRQAVDEFIRFHDRVYAGRDIRWPAAVPFQTPIVSGQGPFAEDRAMRPFVARENGAIVARVLAVIDRRYMRHWNERLGHLNMFEALPGSRLAVQRLLETACDWLREHGLAAARSGFGVLEFPFVIDEYDALPPSILRQNPPYYHGLLKDAGFESEQGWVDYKIEVLPALVARWRDALAAGRRAGYEIVPLRAVAEERRAAQFVAVWNEAFERHWGQSPFTEPELALMLGRFGPAGMLDTSVLAYQGSEPVGVLWVTPEATASALRAPRRPVRDSERLNFLGIGVRPAARGRGVNMAMAAYAFLELVERGATHVSYTLVLDDNWPSRRTAEKLGATICANYLTYRRDLHR